jgi:hypothetical protein
MNGMAQGPAEFMENKEQVRAGMDDAYNSYLNTFKEIFQNIRNGMLVEASSSLIERFQIGCYLTLQSLVSRLLPHMSTRKL